MAPPVNKRDLSTRENGEFTAEGAINQPGQWSASARDFSLRRVAKTITSAKCLGYRRSLEATRCCQQNRTGSSKLKFWLPKNTVFQLFLSRFLNGSNPSWGPRWIRTSECRPRQAVSLVPTATDCIRPQAATNVHGMLTGGSQFIRGAERKDHPLINRRLLVRSPYAFARSCRRNCRREARTDRGH